MGQLLDLILIYLYLEFSYLEIILGDILVAARFGSKSVKIDCQNENEKKTIMHNFLLRKVI